MKPPANQEVEMLLIATAFLAPKLWNEIAFVRGEEFSDPFNGNLWEAIKSSYERGEKPSVYKISEGFCETPEERKDLRKSIADWMASVISPTNGEEYARMVRDLYDRRRLLAIAEKLAMDAVNTAQGNPADITGRLSSDLSASMGARRETLSAFQVGMEIAESLNRPMNYNATRFARLDSALGGGLYQNKFYGIGARMKSGKSLLLATLAYNMTVLGSSRVLYLCLEMGYEETFQRLLARKMGYNSREFLDPNKRLNKTFQHDVRRAAESFKDCGLYFQARPRVDVDDLRSIIAQEAMSGHVDGIIVDYLQLVTGKQRNQSLSEHYDHVAQTMAECVKRFPIWILTAAQLNQDGNIRGGEGLLNACDITFALHKLENAGAVGCDEAWLEMMASRYTPYCNVGSEKQAGYQIVTNIGPMFSEHQLQNAVSSANLELL